MPAETKASAALACSTEHSGQSFTARIRTIAAEISAAPTDGSSIVLVAAVVDWSQVLTPLVTEVRLLPVQKVLTSFQNFRSSHQWQSQKSRPTWVLGKDASLRLRWCLKKCLHPLLKVNAASSPVPSVAASSRPRLLTYSTTCWLPTIYRPNMAFIVVPENTAEGESETPPDNDARV